MSEQPIFLTGSVSVDGEPVDGAEIAASVWPETDDSQVGDSIELYDADTAVSDDDGAFTLYVDPDAIPTKYFGHDRSYLNFEIRVFDGTNVAMWQTTLYPVGSPTVWRTEETAVAADAPLEMHVDLGEKRLTTIDSFGESTSSDLVVQQPTRVH